MFSLDDFDQLKLNKIIVNTATKNSPKNIEEYMKEIEVDLEVVLKYTVLIISQKYFWFLNCPSH